MKRFSDENEFCVKNRTTYKYSVISEFVRSVRNDIYFSRLQEKIVPNFKLSKIKYYSFPPLNTYCANQAPKYRHASTYDGVMSR